MNKAIQSICQKFNPVVPMSELLLSRSSPSGGWSGTSRRSNLFIREMPPIFQDLTTTLHLSIDYVKYHISRRCHGLIQNIS